MELHALPFARASHRVTREEKGPLMTPPTSNETNAGSDAAGCRRNTLSDSNSALSSVFASVARSPWSTSVRVCRAVPSCSRNGAGEGALQRKGPPALEVLPRGELPRKGPSALEVLPRPSQLRSRGGKARSRKRRLEGTPAIVDHLAQLRRKEQGFSTGYFGSPHEETSGYDDPSIASSVSEKGFQMVPSSPSLKRLCSSAERAWLGRKQHTHAPFNSASEPSVLKLPLEDDPSQFDNNWTLFSAPQEGIKWESGDPFLQRNGERGSERHLNVDSGYGSVTLGLQEGIHAWSSSQGRGDLSVWGHHSCEDLSHLEEGEGESTLLQPSRNTDQVSFWLCDRADDGGGGEDGSVPVGLGRHRSIGHSTDPVSSTPAVCPSLQHHHEATPSHQCSAVWPNVPSVPADEGDGYASYPSSSSTQQHRHWRCNREESPLIPWEE